MFKYVLMTNIFLILVSLGFGAFFLAKDEKNSKKLVASLSFRVGLSIMLVVLVVIGFANGWIAPHQI
jgi:O-antigen/teichoic acid export membrane protein